jgi:hypothetical protein
MLTYRLIFRCRTVFWRLSRGKTPSGRSGSNWTVARCPYYPRGLEAERFQGLRGKELISCRSTNTSPSDFRAERHEPRDAVVQHAVACDKESAMSLQKNVGQPLSLPIRGFYPIYVSRTSVWVQQMLQRRHRESNAMRMMSCWWRTAFKDFQTKAPTAAR